MKKFEFEKDGINYTIISANVGEDIAKMLESQFTHKCKLCGREYKSDKEYLVCENGCEGLIKRGS